MPRIGETQWPSRISIPWNRGRDVAVRRSDETSPFLTLHREMNRLFDDVFRGFDIAPMGFGDRLSDRGFGWPNIEVSESANEVKVTAELPGLDEKDVDIHLADGVLTISGEKKTEIGGQGTAVQRALLRPVRTPHSR